MKKIFLLSLIIVMNLSVLSFAESNTLIIDVPKVKLESIERQTMENIIENEKKLAPEYEYKYVKVGSQTKTKVKIGYAAGQKSNGTVFSSPGGFYWQDGGNNVSISVSVAYGVFSVSASPGSVQNSGKWISSPYVGKPCKLLIYKDIEISKIEVYRKRAMTSESWKLYKTEYPSKETREYLEVVKVN